MPDEICVTGGGGFIGSHLVQECVSQGFEVHVVDNFLTGYRRNLQSVEDSIRLHEIDIRDEESMRQILRNVDWVFHQAALPSVPRSIKKPVRSTDITLLGTINLLEQARRSGVQRIIYASSSSVYGNQKKLPKREDMVTDPRSPYAAAKDACETFSRIFSDGLGIETVGLRYFNVFGPRQDPNSEYAAVIPAFIQALLSDEQPIIYGDGEQSRDFTYVRDVVQANFAAVRSGIPGKVYNVGYDQQTTVNELHEILANLIDSKVAPRYEDPRPGDVRHSRAQIDELRKDTSFNPEWNLRRGLKETVQWFKKHPETWTSSMKTNSP